MCYVILKVTLDRNGLPSAFCKFDTNCVSQLFYTKTICLLFIMQKDFATYFIRVSLNSDL